MIIECCVSSRKLVHLGFVFRSLLTLKKRLDSEAIGESLFLELVFLLVRVMSALSESVVVAKVGHNYRRSLDSRPSTPGMRTRWAENCRQIIAGR